MLRKISIPLLIMVISLSLLTDGFANGYGRKVTNNNGGTKRVTVRRPSSSHVTVSQKTTSKVVRSSQVKTVTARNGLVVRFRPPAPRVEVIPVRPTPTAVWISGYWTYDYFLEEWVWVSGYWDLYPVSRVWVSGYWMPQDSVWVWVDGYWRF